MGQHCILYKLIKIIHAHYVFVDCLFFIADETLLGPLTVIIMMITELMIMLTSVMMGMMMKDLEER